MKVSTILPPGQRAITAFPRFGLPTYLRRWPKIPSRPLLQLGGEVHAPCEIGFDELAALPRREQDSDLHCVATWSRCGLHWSGYRPRDVYERCFVSRAQPHPEVRSLVGKGLDGYWARLPLEDALAADVLLADRLADQELSIEHGAPLRVVAPAHDGYKSVKHLCALELWREVHAGAGGWLVHPRGRVALEARSRGLPGWVFRWLYRTTLPATLRSDRRVARRQQSERSPGGPR
jgi:DMSO/TMAO reductase YedYZ molybdopterin-dependent catalytic subunit